MNVMKILFALLSLSGLALLSLRSGALQEKARVFLDRFSHDTLQEPVPSPVRKSPEHHLEDDDKDELQHRKWWGHHDEDKNSNPKWRFHQAMKQRMMEVRMCHFKCGMDRECHEQCPKPWAFFEQKCEEYKPISSCHAACWKSRGGIACHDRCPKPRCPWMSRKMQAARACHIGCGHGNFKCHMSCPRPLVKLMRKCNKLEKVLKCHRKCGHGDCACHHNCPKMMPLWHHGSAKVKQFIKAKMHALTKFKEVLV